LWLADIVEGLADGVARVGQQVGDGLKGALRDLRGISKNQIHIG
jgi:hypothetical protein